MAPTTRSAQSAPLASQARDPDGDLLEPAVELFPFCGQPGGGVKCRPGEDSDLTAPGEWPFDRQCVLRLPEDLGERLAGSLRQAEEQGADAQELDLEVRPLRAQHGQPAGRVWAVRAFGETLNGTLVDLPCHAETHVVPTLAPGAEASEGGPSTTVYKAADVTQMLIVHRGPEPTGADKNLDRRTFQWASGLTPPTQNIRRRKFRGRPPPGSTFSAERVAEAVAVLRERVNGEPYVYEELTEVDEAEYLEILRTQPENVWRPPPEQARAASAVSLGASTSSAPAAGGAASAASAPLGARRAGSSVLSTSSGGSGGGSTLVAPRGGTRRLSGSAASEGAGSGSTAAKAEAGGAAQGGEDKRRRMSVKIVGL